MVENKDNQNPVQPSHPDPEADGKRPFGEHSAEKRQLTHEGIELKIADARLELIKDDIESSKFARETIKGKAKWIYGTIAALFLFPFVVLWVAKRFVLDLSGLQIALFIAPYAMFTIITVGYLYALARLGSHTSEYDKQSGASPPNLSSVFTRTPGSGGE